MDSRDQYLADLKQLKSEQLDVLREINEIKAARQSAVLEGRKDDPAESEYMRQRVTELCEKWKALRDRIATTLP